MSSIDDLIKACYALYTYDVAMSTLKRTITEPTKPVEIPSPKLLDTNTYQHAGKDIRRIR